MQCRVAWRRVAHTTAIGVDRFKIPIVSFRDSDRSLRRMLQVALRCLRRKTGLRFCPGKRKEKKCIQEGSLLELWRQVHCPEIDHVAIACRQELVLQSVFGGIGLISSHFTQLRINPWHNIKSELSIVVDEAALSQFDEATSANRFDVAYPHGSSVSDYAHLFVNIGRRDRLAALFSACIK